MKKILFILSILALFVSIPVGVSSASIEYKTLAPIGNFVGTSVSINQDGTSLSKYLNDMYKLGIALCTGLAVLMIVIGGIEYMGSGSWGGKDEGKKKINAALIGLLIALGSYIILNSLDSRLLSTTLDLGANVTPGVIDSAQTPTQDSVGQGTQNTGQGPVKPTVVPEGKSEQQVRDALAQNGISVPKPPCTNGQTLGCTNVAGLGDGAITGLAKLKNSTNSEIILTGGTEGGHDTHAIGNSIVDIRHTPQIDAYVQKNTVSTRYSSLGPVSTLSDGTTWLNESSGGDHWHIVFK